MNSISSVFFYSLLQVLIFPMLFPSWHLTFFAPFLIFSYYRSSFLSCLWLSLLCGIIIDILSAAPYLGIHAMNYCVVTWILYQQKQNYFEDSLSTLPLLTAFFAVLSTLIQAVLMYLTNSPIDFSWLWVSSDLIKMSLWDALYAFMWFTVPLSLLPRPPQRRDSFLLNKIQRSK
jgi:rod shape-determining protein MreD